MTPEKVVEVQKYGREPISLHTPLGEDGDSEFGDLIEDSEAIVPADAVSFTLLQEQLHAVLDTLSEREAGVVSMRFGLTDGQPKTLDEIGKVYGVTRERIRQIESKTMSKLRHPHAARCCATTSTEARRTLKAFVQFRGGLGSLSCDTLPDLPPVLDRRHRCSLVSLTIDRRQLSGFVDHLLDHAQPATARVRQLAVRRFSLWLEEEGEQDTDPLLGVKPPKLDSKVIEPLSDAQLKAMLKACAGPELRDRRDEAILRLMVETGARAGEVAVLESWPTSTC